MQLPAPDCSTEQLQLVIATNPSSDPLGLLESTQNQGPYLWMTVKEVSGERSKRTEQGAWEGRELCFPGMAVAELPECSFGFL